MAEIEVHVEILIQRLPGNDLPLPEAATAASSGFDLRACVDAPLTIQPGARTIVATGFALAIPEGWEAQIRPRSGLALDRGLTMLNAPGTIDADYRGEVKLIAVNHGSEPVVIRRGDRIAQMVFARVPRVRLTPVASLPPSSRGAGGFGHTGSS